MMTQLFSQQHPTLRFESVTRAHKKIIVDWLHADHVSEFYYGDGLKNTLRNVDLFCDGVNNNGHYTFFHWIAFYDDTPFAFLMTSPIEGPFDENNDYNKWYVGGKKTFTLDLLIGDPAFLGQGLAPVLITEFIRQRYADADFFLIDPEAKNTKAIHVYSKVGFKKMGEFCPEYNPIPHVMMRLDLGD